MATFRGVLERVDLGPGGWQLRQDDGSTVDLYGDVPKGLAGRRVVVRGSKADAGMLMGGGQAVEVSSVEAV